VLTELLMPWLSGLRLDAIDTVENRIVVTLQSIQSEPKCPKCAQASNTRHSWYQRKLIDLPWAGVCVQLSLRVRRLFCRNPACKQTIFTERLPELVAPHARRTKRVVDEQRQLALSQGGEAAARIAGRQGMPGSAKTMLRFVRRAPLPPCKTPRILGIDDWAMRKGRTYGTILVDLELHRPIDVLADRTSATLEQWLRDHPGVEIISRDRANDYADGAARGAPDAVQVADRFHLLKNIREMLERLLERNHASLRSAAQEVGRRMATVIPPSIPNSESHSEIDDSHSGAASTIDQALPLLQSEQRRQQHRAKRLALYTEVRQLRATGMGIRAIARQLKIDRETVRRFSSDDFPERAKRAPGRSKLTPHIPYLTEQLMAGRSNALQLWRELKSQYGYTGSHGLVSIWVAANQSLCPPKAEADGSRRGRPPKVAPRARPPAFSTPSARRASWLLMAETAALHTDEAEFVECLCQSCEEVCNGQRFANDFAHMLRERDVAALAAWIKRAQTSNIPEVTNFVAILSRDLAAVTAALSLEVSNGQVEGQINRLKLVKRTMYGRANFDLLRRRVLAA
jgi:transposase